MAISLVRSEAAKQSLLGVSPENGKLLKKQNYKLHFKKDYVFLFSSGFLLNPKQPGAGCTRMDEE